MDSPSPASVPRPASLKGPAGPTLRANPFPEVTDLICRLPLPTLIYRLEAIHLGDLLRIWVRARPKVREGVRGTARVPHSANVTGQEIWCYGIGAEREVPSLFLGTSRRQRAYYPVGGNFHATGARSAATLGFRPRLHFQGPTTAHGTPQEPRRSTLPRPYRLASSFQGHGVLNRKENSSPDRRQCMQGHSRYQDRYTLARALGDVLSGTRFWNKYQIPFRLQIYNG